MAENNIIAGNNGVNGGGMSDQDALNAVMGLGLNLGSVSKELEQLTKQLKLFLNNQTGTNNNSATNRFQTQLDRTLSSFNTSISQTSNTIKGLKVQIQQLSAETRRTLSDIKKDRQSVSNGTVESMYLDEQIKIIEKYEQRLKDAEKDVDEREKRNKELSESLEATNAAIESYKLKLKAESEERVKALRKWRDSIGTADETENRKKLEEQTKIVNETRAIIQSYQGSAKSLNNTINNNIEEQRKSTADAKKAAQEEREAAEEKMRAVWGGIINVIQEGQAEFNRSASQSTILADWIQDHSMNEAEQFNAQMNRTRDALTNTINELNRQLSENTELTEEQRENIKQQIKLAEEQRDLVSKVTPATETMHQAGNKIKDVPWNSFKRVVGDLVKIQTGKYLEAYMEAFDRVYQSVESTRNTISARMRLDSGAYKELQDEIQQRIEDEGLAGAVSQIDVNEAFTSLLSAGITDEDTLMQLALEQARLTASGSSVNLTNEKMLSQVSAMMKDAISGGATKDEALQQITDYFETMSAQQELSREEFGHDIAWVNGGFEQIATQIADIGLASGKSIDEIKSDTQSAMLVAEQLAGQDVDTNILMQNLTDLFEGKISDQSAFGQLLAQSGIDRTSLMSGNVGDALKTVYENLNNILQNVDPMYIAEVLGTYGMTGKTSDYMKMLNASENKVPIEVSLSDESNDRLLEIQNESRQATTEGTYLSATAGWQKKMENVAAEQAIFMEQAYDGDKIYHATVGNILNGVNEIIGILQDGLFSVGDQIHTSGFTPVLGQSGTSTLGSFMMGDTSTTAGKIGTGAGIAVGAGVSIYSIAKNISEYDGADAVAATFTDPTFYTGVGTALGSAIAGPVGGAIGAAVGGLSSKLGNWIGDAIAHSGADDLQESANALKDSADALVDSATKQYKDAQKEYDRLSKMTDEEKRLELIKKGYADEIHSGDKSIQELFEENLLKEQENIMSEAVNKMTSSSILSKNAQDFAELKNSTIGYDFDMYGENTQDFITNNLANFENIFGGRHGEALSSIFSTVVGGDLSSDEMKLALASTGISTENMNSDSIQAAYKNMMIDKLKSESGMDVGQQTLFDESLRQYEERKSGYESANESFKKRWKDAGLDIKITTQDQLTSDLNKYFDKYGVVPNVLIDGEKNVYLDPGATGYEAHYLEGQSFETGLTRVPYDGYEAVLHAGERILTKEEAAAYNNLSSYMVEQFSNDNGNFSNYINSFGGTSIENSNQKILETDTLNKSINTQTTALESKLDAILSAMNTLIRCLRPQGRVASDNINILNMNSNVTQIATSH